VELQKCRDHWTVLKGRLASTDESGQEAAQADFQRSTDLVLYAVSTIDSDVKSGKLSKETLRYEKFIDYAAEGYGLTTKSQVLSVQFRQELTSRLRETASAQ